MEKFFREDTVQFFEFKLRIIKWISTFKLRLVWWPNGTAISGHDSEKRQRRGVPLKVFLFPRTISGKEDRSIWLPHSTVESNLSTILFHFLFHFFHFFHPWSHWTGLLNQIFRRVKRLFRHFLNWSTLNQVKHMDWSMSTKSLQVFWYFCSCSIFFSPSDALWVNQANSWADLKDATNIVTKTPNPSWINDVTKIQDITPKRNALWWMIFLRLLCFFVIEFVEFCKTFCCPHDRISLSALDTYFSKFNFKSPHPKIP